MNLCFNPDYFHHRHLREYSVTVSGPNAGTYSTVARFEEDVEWPPPQAWSIVLEIHPNGTTARFLAPGAPQERLAPGRRFVLYEGKIQTASVKVLD
ncbi:hypothetical protein ACHMW7_08905 [Aminobacter sp. UC22_36]|uniref:hypothetical protein n=1 Tax=Aminobacter sp. UC22_36 TaxID=3374549 RepID=UPI00375726AB